MLEQMPMPVVMTLVLATCAIGLILSTVWELYSESGSGRIPSILSAIVIVVYLVWLHYAFGFPSFYGAVAKGEEGSVGPLVLALFICMLLGMVAEYGYHYLDSKSKRTKFNWRSFVKPFLISPLVFVPLAATLQNAKVDLSHLNIPLVMLFLVAFENGFLWRGYFTRKLVQSSKG